MDIITILIITLTIINTLLIIVNHHKTKPIQAVIVILTAILLLFHLKNMRWQLYPIYSLIFIYIFTVILFPLFNQKYQRFWKKRIIKMMSKFLLILIILSSILATYAFPIYKMPQPTGAYKIGTERYDLVDNSRLEIYTEDPSDFRHIQYQIWYPTDQTKGYEKENWLPDGVTVARGVADMMGLPRHILDHTANIESNSYSRAPISESQSNYPVVVISHGWTGFRNIHTDFAEELASHGYIVVSIDHTYGAAVTVFEDGTTLPLNRDALPSRDQAPDFLSYGNRLVNTYAGDITQVLNHIELLQAGTINSQFKGKINLEKIGLLGHSTGAGAGVTTAIKEERIKAIIGLDAWVEPMDEDLRIKGLTQPSLFLRSQQWENGENNPYLVELLSKSNKTNLFQMKGTNHVDFTMVYMYSPLSSKLGITGSLDGKSSSLIQKEFIMKFFNTHLKDNRGVTIDDVSKKYNDNVLKINFVEEYNDYQYEK